MPIFELFKNSSQDSDSEPTPQAETPAAAVTETAAESPEAPVQETAPEAPLADPDEEAALHGADAQTRLSAIPRVRDQALLKRIATTEENMTVRIAALRAISDQAVLNEIVMGSRYEADRTAALMHLTDQDMIYENALRNTVSRIRNLAERKLDEEHLCRLLYQADLPDTAKLAMISRITNSGRLITIILDDRFSYRIRLQAASHLELDRLHPAEASAVTSVLAKLREEEKRQTGQRKN